MGDLPGRPAEVVDGHTLYQCLDRLLGHKRAFLSFPRDRWETLFEARFDVPLYDLTSKGTQTVALRNPVVCIQDPPRLGEDVRSRLRA